MRKNIQQHECVLANMWCDVCRMMHHCKMPFHIVFCNDLSMWSHRTTTTEHTHFSLSRPSIFRLMASSILHCLLIASQLPMHRLSLLTSGYQLSAIGYRQRTGAGKSQIVSLAKDDGHQDERHVVMQQCTIEVDMRVHVRDAVVPRWKTLIPRQTQIANVTPFT